MIRIACVTGLVAAFLPCLAPAQQAVNVFAEPENLEVLPADISPAELRATMRGFATGLGVRCETCHVGEAGQPLTTFDFAADEKAMKQKARLMLRMVQQINGELVPELDRVEKASRVPVRCVTCHRGRPKPELIQDVLDDQMARGGVDAAISEYRALRDAFYGSHSYDFSEMALPLYAQGLAADGDTGAAIALAELNTEFFPDSYFTAMALGGLYGAAGRAADAIASYERALELNPRAAPFLGPRIEALKSN
jgi:tetratricopeptide (TPR) repeat protein